VNECKPLPAAAAAVSPSVASLSASSCLSSVALAEGLMDSARHVNKRDLSPRFLIQTASYHVSSRFRI